MYKIELHLNRSKADKNTYNCHFIMHRKLSRLFLNVTILFLISQNLFSQTIDTTYFKIYPRFSFYSYEKNGEFLLHILPGLSNSNLSIEILVDGEVLSSMKVRPGKTVFRIPFNINFSPAVYKVTANIYIAWRPGVIYRATTELPILKYKPNEVKTDRLTGGLIVNRRQFFPFGFYCYSPLFPTMAEEEAVRGFNFLSPYQKILPETLDERKAYMDRCAQLGMKVNYNLLSVSGGGGVGSKIDGITDEEKKKRLISEIQNFMDHPALLGWYISDEPNGIDISPEQLEDIYKTVKKTDPWHPVSIVFMSPFISSKDFINSMDIVMADPYLVPNLPVSMVANITGQLEDEFAGKRPVWIVPQAFGGGEIWEREPTLQEVRSMTWQSIIKGATGIQYFVRQGPNYFPKSTATWGECGRIATEVAELTPWLLSDEEAPQAESFSSNIIVSSRLHNGQLIIMAVNKINAPVPAGIRIKGFGNGKALVMFENRTVNISGGVISDQIAPYGTETYLIKAKTESGILNAQFPNLVKDPGFEDLSNPGIPSACYARPGGDRGATYFLDTREHYEGNHSLRLITPVQDKGVSIRLFPFYVKTGASYVISIWAKSDPEQRFFNVTNQENKRLLKKKELPQYVEILLGDFGRARFVPDKEWRQFVTFVTIPNDTVPRFKTNLILKMPGQGVAWFDEIKVFEEKE
jgi:hypothetical protein